MNEGTLYIVATPIGNLEDITIRALRILREVDTVLCEDTRVTGKLLAYYNVDAALQRYDAHSGEQTHLDIIAKLESGQTFALVSDAGTPGVSDPGVLLVEQVRQAGLRLEVIPGPSAVTAAVSLAGFTGNQFTFLGFAPQKKGRETFFAQLTSFDRPVVFFESTHRIMKALEQLASHAPNTPIYVCRELTKLHEECIAGSVAEIIELFTTTPVKQKGEFVIIIDPR